MTAFDTDFVRSQFPAFSEPSLEGWAFFENAGGSYPCRQVTDRLAAFYQRLKVQPYWSFPASKTGGAWMDESRTRLAALMGVAEDEIHFGTSTSQNTYVLAQAVRQAIDGGMDRGEIVVTDQDHEANSGVWRRLAGEGFTIREWTIDPDTGHLEPAALDDLLSDRTCVVCFPHASNIVAEINPVAEICAKIRAAGAISVVDGVSYAPHGIPDVAALGADVYMFSAYKTHGPHQGVMTVRRAAADRLEPQCHGFNRGNRKAWFTPAGPDHAQIAALAGMVDYAEELSARHGGASAHDLMRGQEIALMQPLMDWLAGRNDIRLLGPSDPFRRAPTVSLVHQRSGEDLAEALVAHKIMAGGGCFYSDRCVAAQGVATDHGVLRLSFLHYTSEAEIRQVIAALDQVL
ncbi:MAG: aminotransferase class V-fold PLP-dependent enzyme [Pseudomonadota bacterium]